MTRPTTRRVAPRRPPSPRRLRRHGRRWPWALALLPVAAAAGWWWQRDDRGEPASAEAPPSAPGAVAFGAPSGERTTGARCIVVAIDESTSMSSADRSGARADAVRATASFLATHGLDGDRLGTTWFAERASSTDPVPPQEAAPLDPPTTLGAGTSISAGLREAQRSLERGCGEATKVVVLVSDGEASGPGEFAAARNAVTSVDGVALHLIAMNEGGAFEPSRAFWEDPQLGLASIQTIDGFGRDEMAGAVAAILSMETGQAVTSS